MPTTKRLYRARTQRMIAGVCGGIGDYYNIDPVVVRLIFVIFAFANGLGILVYLIGMIIIPEEPIPAAEATHERTSKEQS